MEKSFEKHKIELAIEMYDEFKFMVRQFQENKYNLENEKDLYKIISNMLNINYLLNRIYDVLPENVRPITKKCRKINYEQLCYLGVQYQELYNV